MTLPVPTVEELDALRLRIVEKLHPEMLQSPYDTEWTSDNPTYGFCSIASEAAWFLLGGKEAGWVAHNVRDTDGSTHWWLEHQSGLRFDPTADQYYKADHTPPYERGIKGRPGGFMGMRKDPDSPWGNERKPGLRAQELLARMNAVPTPILPRPKMR